jgi:hypothetical protein
MLAQFSKHKNATELFYTLSNKKNIPTTINKGSKTCKALNKSYTGI